MAEPLTGGGKPSSTPGHRFLPEEEGGAGTSAYRGVVKPAAHLGVSRWERLRTIDPRLRDGLLGAGAFALALIGAFSRDPAAREPDVLSVALVAAGTLPLMVRRRAPIVVLAVIGAAAAAYALRDGSSNLAVSLALAVYSAASLRDRRTVVSVALPIAVAASALIAIAENEHRNWIEVLLALVPVPGVPMLLGRVSFNRRRRIERDHVLAARAAVAAERARIARELHDVVAHSMSVMVVQAGAARAILARDPSQAVAALEHIEETGRTGLAEMRRLLGILEEHGDGSDLAPQPGLSELNELLERFRAAGLPVEAVVRGRARPLPPGVDVTAYRLVQEALTNSLRHAGQAHARVVIGYVDGGLELEVVDDGRGTGGRDPGGRGMEDAGASGGRGLVGMRERVAVFGGSLETGARPGGGFRVAARIPVGPAGEAPT